MEMIILKSAACLALLMLFYKFFLEKENMHVFKRFYLLFSVLVSAAIPFITFTEYVETAPLLPVAESPLVFTETSTGDDSSWISILLWPTYLMGATVFGFIFLRNLYHITRKIRLNQKIKEGKIATVLLAEDLPPHTFWNYIFLNKQKFEKRQIPKEVFEHEEAHARQKHTLDILFLELLQVFFWFNPLIYLLKRAVKLNHEFLADRAVLKKGTNTAIYQELLLNFSSKEPQSALINSINYSLIKKRFTVMKTRTSKTTSVVKAFLLLPLLALLLFSFSTRETVLLEKSSVELQETVTPEMIAYYNKMAKRYSSNWKKNGVTFIPTEYIAMQDIYRIMTIEQKRNAEPFPKIPANFKYQEKATPEMVAEYNKMAEHYNSMPTDRTFIKKKDYERMKYIYGLMTLEQKKKAEPFPIPSPPPPPNSAMIAEYNKLARHFNALGKEGIVRADRYNRMVFIYDRMSAEQKEKAEKFPDLKFPSPPPPPTPPVPPVPEEGKVSPPPQAPPVPAVERVGQVAPPPPPPSPVEGVKKWIEEGAEFFYNGKAITGEEALKIVRKNEGKNLSVEVVSDGSDKIVRIFDK